MDNHSNRGPASSSSGALKPDSQHKWLVVILSGAGVAFILLGLVALALPTANEGMQIWQLDDRHALYTMDIAGAFVVVLGFILIWVASIYWSRRVLV